MLMLRATRTAQARALDLDLGEAGLIQQQRELTNERAVVALEVCG